MRRAVARASLVVVAAAVALLVVEGVLSLCLRRSLRPRPFEDVRRLVEDPEARDAAARLARFTDQRVHVDPRVGWMFTPGEKELVRARATIGPNGLRARPGPPPDANALRVVVLGDSVAFGLGLSDEHTIAARLEAHLNAVRGPKARPVAAWTVALPSWNCKNAVYALLDTIDEYRPDVVLYIALGNDLVDSFAVWHDGARHVAPDPTTHEPLLYVNDESRYGFQMEFHERVKRGESEYPAADLPVGPYALVADLSAESRRRYDANTRTIAMLDGRLNRRGARLAVMFYDERRDGNAYVWHLRAHLAQVLPNLLFVPGLSFIEPSFTLGYDAHPNPATANALALYAAADLLEAGMIDRGANAKLPELARPYRDARARRTSNDEIRAISAALLASERAKTGPSIDLRTGRGMLQIYGGYNPDGTIGPRFCAILKRAGPKLRVTFEPLDDAAPKLLQFQVEVRVDGVGVGRFAVMPGAERTESFVLPAKDAASAAAGSFDDLIEVELVPSDWTLHKIRDYEVNASFRLLELATADGS